MLEKAKTPNVGPAGSPSGRHEKSPIENLVKSDVFAGEGVGLEGMMIPDPIKGNSPIGRHESSNIVIQKPDVFANIK